MPTLISGRCSWWIRFWLCSPSLPYQLSFTQRFFTAAHFHPLVIMHHSGLESFLQMTWMLRISLLSLALLHCKTVIESFRICVSFERWFDQSLDVRRRLYVTVSWPFKDICIRWGTVLIFRHVCSIKFDHFTISHLVLKLVSEILNFKLHLVEYLLMLHSNLNLICIPVW